MTAKIITIQKMEKTHKENHPCFQLDYVLKIFQFNNFCPQCGEKIVYESSVTYSYCSACHESLMVPERMKYCSNCGEKFEK